ncbi:Interleukin-1 receptor-associated kinase 4 [Microtus ochrogaster]|uniref:Interleukin-1 receptor-associated kinase 4 n=1 Tax=Microtus ochrogaster TaxID=79684 RepID=A0A8J6FVJ2_MICOH|nr:Interleukin-1 receptor-associated kinase 4 [Microtus ochrogaster]
MNKPLTPSTYVRSLNVGLIRKLSDFIDPQEGWKKLAVAIKKPSGDDRYNQFHIRRFEALLQTGKSPTCELLFDWGTTNCTVGDLVDLLIQIELFAPATLLLPGFHSFSFYELKSITNDFDERPVSVGGSRMGEGGFGVVYKGHMKDTAVAVKKLGAMVEISTEELKEQFDQEIKVMAKLAQLFINAHSSRVVRPCHASAMFCVQGRTEAEVASMPCVAGPGGGRTVALLSCGFCSHFSPVEQRTQIVDKHVMEDCKHDRCQHENLVELLGFSSDSDNLCLVYAYMPNGSLLDRLSCLDGTPPLSWHMRCKIAQGAANGISFLHENHHIHRDIKSANILLDKDFTAKISDFGLARASAKFAQTVMTSRIVGTTAYMAPEALRGEITPKSDIYSFGVVLLELITGLAAVDENREPQLLLDIKEEIEDEEKTIGDYTDEKMDDTDPASIEAMYAAASQCLQEKKNKRPDIAKVQQLLQEMPAEHE